MQLPIYWVKNYCYTAISKAIESQAALILGMWDSQGGVPFTGDYPMHYNTVYAIELNTTVHIPQWDKDIRIMLEEAGFFGENGFRYVNSRQKTIKGI